MKNLELENYGVQELQAIELKRTDGGIWPAIAWGAGIVAGYLLEEIATNPISSHKKVQQGFDVGYNSYTSTVKKLESQK